MSNPQFETLYEDGHIIVCIKPAGVPVQTRKTGTADMVSLLKNYFAPTGAQSLSVIHRLDQPVEGLLVFAKTRQAAKELNRQLQTSGFGKHYLAVVCGPLPGPRGTLRDFLLKDGRTNTSRVCAEGTPMSRYAELSYEVVSSLEDGTSLVRIALKTGRHHQIRVQMAHAGAPLWGDSKYNPGFIPTTAYHPVALCAFRLEFTHPVTGKPMEFQISPTGPGFEPYQHSFIS